MKDDGAETAIRRWLWASAGIAVLTVVVAAVAALGADLERGEDFLWLFGHHELAAAVLALGLLALAPALARWLGDGGERLARWMAARPALVATAAALLLAAGSLTVYQRYPLTMDEYAPVFQARAFAAGHLSGEWPPELLPWLLPRRIGNYFFSSDAAGQVLSKYWPGHALLLAPLAAVGGEWLLSPLLAGVAVLLLMALARRLHPGDETAPGWVALLALASPAFVVNGISFYAMTAHLTATLLYVWLLASGGRGRAFVAGIVGSLALVLHQPVPHLLMAAPWIAWLAFGRERRRLLPPLALGYLPLLALLGVGWPLWRIGLAATSPVPTLPLPVFPFAPPSLALAWLRLLELLKLASWAVPGLLLLAILGWRRQRRAAAPAARQLSALLAASAGCVLAGYTLLVYDQGHGWSYRHFHVVWGVLPLFAAAPLLRDQPGRARWAALVGALALGSLIAGNGLRAVQVHRLIEERRGLLPAPPPARPLVCFVDLEQSFYLDDLVRNDPFLRADLLLLGSRGAAADGDLLARRFAGAQGPQRRGPLRCWRVAERSW